MSSSEICGRNALFGRASDHYHRPCLLPKGHSGWHLHHPICYNESCVCRDSGGNLIDHSGVEGWEIAHPAYLATKRALAVRKALKKYELA